MAGAAKWKVRSRRAAVAAPAAAADAPAAGAPPCTGAVGDSGCRPAACWPRLVAAAGVTTLRCVVGAARRGAGDRSSARAAVAGDVRGSAVRRCVTPGRRDGGRAWDASTFCQAWACPAGALCAAAGGAGARVALSTTRAAVAAAESAVRFAVRAAESTTAPAERTVSLTSRSAGGVGGWTAFVAVCTAAVVALAVSVAPAAAAVAAGAAAGAAEPTVAAPP